MMSCGYLLLLILVVVPCCTARLLIPPLERPFTVAEGKTDVKGLHTPQGCPAWIMEYAAFHAQQRGQPGTRYLVHSVRHGNSGLGDRVRGMLFATRLAAASQRVVLFTWRHSPDEPSAFFTPASTIDWTLPGTGYYSSEDQEQNPQNLTMASSLELDAYNFVARQQATLQEIKQGLLLQGEVAGVQYITLHTNERAESDCAACPPLDRPMRKQDSAANSRAAGAGSNSAACLFRALFKPR
jgi:hypothetical protein